MSLFSKVVIVIPTHRPPPIVTFESFKVPKGARVLVIADPKVYREHRRFYKTWSNVSVVLGQVGVARQGEACYTEARKHGFTYFFRMDDDLGPKTFIHRDGPFVTDLKQLIRWCYECAKQLDVTLVGFQNVSRRNWMSEGYGGTYTLVTGGACFAKAIKFKPKMQPDIAFFDDVYRSCVHRLRDGRLGRVKFVGLNWPSLLKNPTSLQASLKKKRKAMNYIFETFPDCLKEVRWDEVRPAFVYKRHKEYINS